MSTRIPVVGEVWNRKSDNEDFSDVLVDKCWTVSS